MPEKHFLCILWTSLLVLVVKNLPANEGDIRDVGSIPGSARSPGGGNGNPLQDSCLENPMDRGVWQATVHRVAKSQTRLKQLNTHKHTHTHTQSTHKHTLTFCITGLIFIIKIIIPMLKAWKCLINYFIWLLFYYLFIILLFIYYYYLIWFDYFQKMKYWKHD